MTQLLWTFEDYVRFSQHPERVVRHWAFERLTKRHPDRAAEPLVALLDDVDGYVATQSARFLGQTGDLQYGPVLLRHLEQARGNRASHLATALGGLGYQEALPFLLDRFTSLRRGRKKPGLDELFGLADGLGRLGGEEARAALWDFVNSYGEDDYIVAAVIRALFNASRPEDVPRLVARYRAWPPVEYGNRMLVTLAGVVGADRLTDEIGYQVGKGLDAALERAEWWLGSPPSLSESCLEALDDAFEQEFEGLFEALLVEARRIIEERGDDVGAWQAAWETGERPIGYRWRAPVSLALLEAFTAHPTARGKRGQQEAALGLALTCQLAVDRDDQARLEAAPDKGEMLLAILAENRQHVLPDIVTRVADLGPVVVPRLISIIEETPYFWGAIRAAEAIERIARSHPGSCDTAIPVLIQAIHDDQGDYMCEAASSALEAIGPTAVEPIRSHLRDGDTSREIYLTGVLGEIPTEAAVTALLEHWEVTGAAEELLIESLESLGSPRAIEPLYEVWSPGDYLIAKPLLVLCLLNEVERPELDQWRRTVEKEETRIERQLGKLLGVPSQPSEEAVGRPDQRSQAKQGGPSKKERKKKAKVRKSARKKRRKGKRR